MVDVQFLPVIVQPLSQFFDKYYKATVHTF